MNNRDQHGSGAEGGRYRGGGRLTLLSPLLAGLVLSAGLSLGPLWAQTNVVRTAPSSDRCLIIVETSKSMQRRADAVVGAVRGLLASGLDGQLQAGDTLGLWTFNEDLYAGRFPLQTWSAQAQEDITQRTVAFLKAQKYEKLGRFDKVVPAMSRLFNDSELITVILISSGDGEVQGTPIDGRINEYYNQWREQQQKARIPFIIILRVRNGQLVACSLNTAPWPVEMPRLTSEIRTAETVPEDSPKAAPKNPPPAVPPLIVSRNEPQSEPMPTPKPEPTVGKAEALPNLDAAVITNEPVKVRPPEPAAPPAEVAKTEPPPAVGVATTTNEPVKPKPPEPAAPPVEAAKTEPLPTVGGATTTNEPVKAKPPEPAAPPVEVARTEPPSTVGVATTTNEPVKAKPPEPAPPPVEVAKAEPPPTVAEMPANNTTPTPRPAPTPVAQLKQEIPTAPEAKPVEPVPAKPEAAAQPPSPTPTPEPVTIEQPKPSPAPQVTTGAAPTASPTQEITPIAAASAIAAQPAAAATSSLAPRPSSLPTPAVQNATAVPAGTLVSHLNIWIAGLVLAVVAAICSLLLMRRSRATPQGSLITRSFEHEKKP
jgi:hypothetical protein